MSANMSTMSGPKEQIRLFVDGMTFFDRPTLRNLFHEIPKQIALGRAALCDLWLWFSRVGLRRTHLVCACSRFLMCSSRCERRLLSDQKPESCGGGRGN